MKALVNISRVITGILFIFSGFIKANDPRGLSYKMQEYFDVWRMIDSLRPIMLWLDNYALTFSVIIITLEIVVGVAILLGWYRRFFIILLLLLIIFFTFLTGYAVFSGKIKTCGCFGDCIPLSAMQSFIKDLVLFVLIIILYAGQKYILPIFKNTANGLLIIISTIIVLGFQWYTLEHLPVIDCLPFKKGNNVLELRKMPNNAVPDKISFKFVYEKNGTQKEFDETNLPDSTWNFVKREDVILKKGSNNEPPIKDFVVNTLSGADTTEALLNQPGKYYILYFKNIEDTSKWLDGFNAVLNTAKAANTPLYVIASQAEAVNSFFNIEHRFNLPVYSCDVTALKTASRTNPSLYLMEGPVVLEKWGRADFKSAASKIQKQ